MIQNQAVAQTLEEIADLLEIKGENTFRVGAYRTAARSIAGLPDDITAIWKTGNLDDIPGVGVSIAAKIDELLRTGRLLYLEQLKQGIAPGLTQLLQVPGLGARRARTLVDALGILTVEDLGRAANEQRVRSLPGFGPKIEANLLREIERLAQRTHRLPLGVALPVAEEVADLVRRHPAALRVNPAGSIRRMRETIGDIDILVASEQPAAVVDVFAGLPIVREVLAKGDTRGSILTAANLQVDVRVVPPDVYGAALLYFTGSKEHNITLRELALRLGITLSEYGAVDVRTRKLLAAATEEEVYGVLGLPWIPPELREDHGEIEAARAGRLPRLIVEADLRGDLHMHTDQSDGSAPLDAMVEAARRRGYEYCAVTDHSVGLGIAHGLTAGRVEQQHKAIEKLNRSVEPFRILRGAEVDIRRDGSLDYPDEILARFDIVTASVHSAFDQPSGEVTSRIVKALSNPYVDVFNHPTGRLLEKREGYPVDLAAVIEAAKSYGVALEINSQPDRLDLNDIWARRARDAGVPLVIDSDSHATGQLALVRYGIAVARRGWVEAANVLNALPLKEFLGRLRRNRGLAGRR